MYKKLEREGRSWLWPLYDVKLQQVFETWRDIHVAIKYCKETRCCIQAGGAVGVFPWHLADVFDSVYSFEPDPRNFRCLVSNTREKLNIYSFNAGLGGEHGGADMWWLPHEVNNAGALHITHQSFRAVEGKGRGPIPVLCIDDFIQFPIDLIYLDIEGSEVRALEGANRTIARWRPVIAVEEKGLSRHFGGGNIHALMQMYRYKLAEKVHRDLVFVPEEYVDDKHEDASA